MTGDTVRLERGCHSDADAGWCLMEYVSHLAGEPFTFLPRCTHPGLAALAVQINDRTSDAGRPALAAYADRLRLARSDDTSLVWQLVAACSQTVLELSPEEPRELRRLSRAIRADRRRQRAVPPRLRRYLPRWLLVAASLTALDELSAAVHAVLRAAGPAGSPERDATLAVLLDRSLYLAGVPASMPTRTAAYAR